MKNDWFWKEAFVTNGNNWQGHMGVLLSSQWENNDFYKFFKDNRDNLCKYTSIL